MKTIKAPLDGYLVSLTLSAGDCVQKGQVLAVILILKMENPVICDRDGVIKEVFVRNKSRVKRGQPLLSLTEARDIPSNDHGGS